MRVVLGVDGGGTATNAVVTDVSGRVLGATTSGPSNWEDVGLGGAGAAFRVAVGQALEEAGLEPEDIVHSVFGLAGVDWPSDAERLAFAIDPLRLGGGRDIVNDSFVAIRAGTDNPCAVAVVCGTGSVVSGRNADGTMFRTLGLGPLFGDFSSSSEVSEEAVRAVARAYIGRGPATSLSERLGAHFGARSPAELLEMLSRRDLQGRVEDTIENVSPIVIASAEDGDGVAREILDRAGRELGGSVVLVAARLGMLTEDFDVVLTGGFLKAAGAFVLEPLEQVVRLGSSRASFVSLDVPPVVGAVLMALTAIGVAATPELRATVAEGLPAAITAGA